MTPKGRHFKLFRDHTLAKHFLLRAYLETWGSILLKRFDEIWFIDAFAGAGRDEAGNLGSPLIAAEIAQKLNRVYYPSGLSNEGDGIRIACYEIDTDIFAALRNAIASVAKDPHVFIVARHGSLDRRIDPVVKFLAGIPTLFFLDPFGIAGLSADVVEKLLQGDHHELLILLADEGAVRLTGKARAGSPDEGAMIHAAEDHARAGGDLFGEEGVTARIETAKAAAKRSMSGHKSNPQGASIMDVAYGGSWAREIIDAAPEHQRQEKAAELYERVLRERGAKYVLRFSICTKKGRHKYFLMHASKSPRAHAAMKRAMHRTRRHADPDAMFEAFETSAPIALIVAEVVGHFVGRQHVRWDRDPTESIRAWAIEETPIWYHETEALKKALTDSTYADRTAAGKLSRPLTFSFSRAI